MILSRLFQPKAKRSPLQTDAAERLKQWTRSTLSLPETATVTVSEIDCNDPACLGVETVVLVLQAKQKTRAYKIGKPMHLILEAELHNAFHNGAQ